MILFEENIFIKENVSLSATISCAEKNKISPAIVFIMGTGKTDRDGNAKWFKTDFYKNLSDIFVNLGFVCVRYDKRGTFKSSGKFSTAGLDDLTHDACSVIQFTKKLPYVDSKKVIILGHSEGAMIATLLTKKENVAGLLLLGGAGISMKDALFYQNKIVAEEFSRKKGLLGFLLKKQVTQEKTNAKVEAMIKKCSLTTKEKIFFGGAFLNAKWIREHAKYSSEDYVSLLKNFEKPILAITGTADLSTDYTRLFVLENIPFIEIYTPNKVNHILREIDDDNSILSAKKQYKRLSKNPIHTDTAEKIANWLMIFKE